MLVPTESLPAASNTLPGDAGWLGSDFAVRHLGPRAADIREMLGSIGYDSLDRLAEAAVPTSIQLREPLRLPPPMSETEALAALRQLARQNHTWRSFIGLGYYGCITPPVILRNVLENPGWYTQYTPYQAEISQGRLEGLLNFQTMICDLTGLAISNASLLDEATAAAEAMSMAFNVQGGEKRNRFLVAKDCFPQTIAVVKTRALALGIEVCVEDHRAFALGPEVFGVLVQYPAGDGTVHDYEPLMKMTHEAGALGVVAADLLALTLLRPPGEFGADIAVGSAQRFGVPMGYGGPHAAYLATRDTFKRHLPGRLVGVSKDSRGRPALRLTLQTREQHIRRERATSNICTAQALLANMAAFYAIYHGPEGLRAIASRVHHLAALFAAGLRRLGYAISTEPCFDTVIVPLGSQSGESVLQAARAREVNLRLISQHQIGVSFDEVTTEADVADLWQVFNRGERVAFAPADLQAEVRFGYDVPHARTGGYLTHPVFNRYRSETEMLRYLRRLESRDLSLTRSMIPLGSCTMKLNATVEMIPVTWPEFGQLHPFAPKEQVQGYARLFDQLGVWLAEITGFEAVSLQPNAGSQGEYAGLLVIRRYLEERGEGCRRVCLIPTSAHGTNPASAMMAGLQVVPVACDASGNVDVADLRAKAAAHRSELAALMITYPSTHGVFEAAVREICQIVHDHGGQVYLDGANLNAQVGLCRPGDMGADVCHLNLHKTFCIPHGGGGPGVGPIAVRRHLAPFLPGHPLAEVGGAQAIGPVSAAPWGSASILPISWMYIAMMGSQGLRQATQVAVLNANYIARRLGDYFPVLYRGNAGLVAHECILDLRAFKSVTVEDVAKRLMDYGFHAPTISWPVAGTMMIEPTESESKEELDRFCQAMIGIHGEIAAIESGAADRRDNLLKNAPHTADMVTADRWDHAYTRQQAAFPVASLVDDKFWPAVGRIDNVHGDRNPICTCVGMGG